jgi:hypothetical protein
VLSFLPGSASKRFFDLVLTIPAFLLLSPYWDDCIAVWLVDGKPYSFAVPPRSAWSHFHPH